MSDDTTTKGRNVINEQELTDWCVIFSADQPAHIQKWWTTIFRRALIQRGKSKPVMDRRELTKPVALLLKVLNPTFDQLVSDGLHLIDVYKYPEYVSQVLARGDTLVYVNLPTNKAKEQYRHWCDYMATLPEKHLSMTVEAMTKKVKEWDKQLERQKLMLSLATGVTEVWRRKTIYLVELQTKEALVAEGQVMRHCVGGSNYWHNVQKKRIGIYSLRRDEQVTPLATVELDLRAKLVAQIKGPCNKQIEDDLSTLIWQYAAAVLRPDLDLKAFEDLHLGDAIADEDEEEDDEDNEEDDDYERRQPVKRSEEEDEGYWE